MRGAVLREPSADLSVEELHIDTPGPDEVLIQTVACGLCHSDLHFIDGTYPAAFPFLPGHEAAGVVQAVGEDVVGIAVGDHVVTCLSVFCGHCRHCLTGHTYLCDNRMQMSQRDPADPPRITDHEGEGVFQMAGLAGFATEMLVHQNAAVSIPADMPLDRAALIGCAVTTGVGAVNRSARVEAGSTVAVIGCGGVGISAVQGAVLAGARNIIAVDLEPRKLEWASDMGATHAVNAADGDPVAQVQELTQGGVDYSFECIGLKQTAEQAYGMIRRGGLATIVGMMAPGATFEIPGADFFLGAKRIQGSFMGSNNFKIDIPHLCELAMSGRLNLEDMVSNTIALEDVNAGFDAMKRGDVVRSVVAF